MSYKDVIAVMKNVSALPVEEIEDEIDRLRAELAKAEELLKRIKGYSVISWIRDQIAEYFASKEKHADHME